MTDPEGYWDVTDGERDGSEYLDRLAAREVNAGTPLGILPCAAVHPLRKIRCDKPGDHTDFHHRVDSAGSWAWDLFRGEEGHSA